MRITVVTAAALIAFATWHLVEADIVSDADEMNQKLASLAQPSVAILKALEVLSEAASSWLALAGPVSALISGFIKLLAKDQTNAQLEAIQKVHTSMIGGFNRISAEIDQAVSRIEFDELLREYNNEVQRPMADLRPEIDLVTNRNLTPTEGTTKNFINQCSGLSGPSPIKILRYIAERTWRRCTLPSEKEHEIAFKVNEVFAKTESRVSRMLDSGDPIMKDYEILRSKIRTQITSLDEEHADQVIADLSAGLRESYETHEELLTHLQEDERLSKLGGGFDICIYRAHADYMHTHRESLLNLTEMIRLDLVELLYMNTACANITYFDSPEQIKRTLREASELVANISSYSKQWIETALKVYWPNGATANIPLLYKAESSGQDLADRLQERVRGSGEAGWLFTVFVAASRLDTRHGLNFRCSDDIGDAQQCGNETVNKKFTYLDTLFFLRRYPDDNVTNTRLRTAGHAWYDAAHIHDEVDKHRDDWDLILIPDTVNKKNGDPLEGKWGVEIYVRATVEKPCPPWGTDKPSMRTGIRAGEFRDSEDWSYWYSGNLVQNAQEIEAYWFL